MRKYFTFTFCLFLGPFLYADGLKGLEAGIHIGLTLIVSFICLLALWFSAIHRFQIKPHQISDRLSLTCLAVIAISLYACFSNFFGNNFDYYFAYIILICLSIILYFLNYYVHYRKEKKGH